MALTYKANYSPTPEQMALHNVPLSPSIKTVVFFGGKKGVGKSAAGLGEAFMFALKYPKSKICIIGETLDNVKDSFLVKLPNLFPDRIINNDGKDHAIYTYYEKSHATFPSRCIVFPNGSFVTFQYCANIKDALGFQGKEFNLIIIDEVTRHEKLEIDLIESTLRSSLQFNPDGTSYWIPTKLVLLGNPGGVGNDWVLKKYIEPCVAEWANIPGTKIPLKTKDNIYHQTVRGREPVKVIQRFIQGANNPYLNSGYLASLEELPDKYKKQYLDGDWAVISGHMFEVKSDQVVTEDYANTFVKRKAGPVFISIDWGYNPSYHAAHWHMVLPNQTVLTFRELYGQDLDFDEFVKEIALMSEDVEVDTSCLPHDMYRRGDQYRDDSGKVIGTMKSDYFEYYGLNPIGVMSGTAGIVAERNSKVRASTNARTQEGRAKFLISESCINLLEELDEAVYDEIKEGHVARGKRNHAIDSYGHFLTYYSDELAPEEGLKTQDEIVATSRLDEMIRKHDEKKSQENYGVLEFEQFNGDFF